MPGRLAGFAYVLCLGPLTTACSAVVGTPDPAALPRTSVVYVVGRDWHTDIGLRAEDMDGPLAAIRQRFPGVRTVLFGFGDRHYLTERRPGVADMVRAAFPGPGALLVTGLRTNLGRGVRGAGGGGDGGVGVRAASHRRLPVALV